MRTKQYYNYTIVNFEPVITQTCIDVVDFYYDNGMELKKLTRDFKKIFVHHFIKNICTNCLNVKGVTDKILFCNPRLISPRNEIFDSLDYNDFILFLKRILKELDGLLPITIYQSVDISFDDIGETNFGNELKYNFDLIHSNSHGHKSIRKLTEYAEELGLNFLHKDYLNQLPLRKIFI